MSNVVDLQEAKPKPQPAIVRLLRDLLDRAESGELRAVAIASQGQGNSTCSSWSLGEDGDVAHLVCAIERVKLRLLQIGEDDR